MPHIQDAITILKEDIKEIRKVLQWAKVMGFSNRRKFSYVFREHFGMRPQRVIIEVRVDVFYKYIAQHPDDKNYTVATEIGLKDEHELYKFINRHTKQPPTYWRKRTTQTDNANGQRKRTTQTDNANGQRKRTTIAL